MLRRLALSCQVLVYDEALAIAVKPVEVLHEHVLWTLLAIRVDFSDSVGLVSFTIVWNGNSVIRINEDYIRFLGGFQSALVKPALRVVPIFWSRVQVALGS